MSPIDWCRDAFCAAAFPRFLAERWGSPALAREVWGARWPKDGAPAPVDTDEVRRALLHGLGSPATLVQWNDTRAFEDAGFAGALAALASEARRARPGLKIALLGASMPSAFGGFDWEEIGPRFDVIEPYDWGATRDLARSTAPRADLFQTITPGGGSVFAISHQIWRGFLRGDRGVILFDATDWTGVRSSRPESRPALADLAPLLLRLESDEPRGVAPRESRCVPRWRSSTRCRRRASTGCSTRATTARAGSTASRPTRTRSRARR